LDPELWVQDTCHFAIGVEVLLLDIVPRLTEAETKKD
jgi:hypothetical protein